MENLAGDCPAWRQSPNRGNSFGTDAFLAGAFVVCAIAAIKQLVLVAL
jgi:hypothetical protein